ncbi:MAG: Uma2 family endonuclease [Phormidesmis sp.]
MAITMTTPVNEIELAPGSAIRLKAVSWQDYLASLQALGEDRSSRIAYSHNILEIRMPGQLHEAINRVLAAVILTLAELMDLEFNNLGSATLNRPDLMEGIEPDSCFYIRSAQAGQGMASPTQVPPDLAVEVDIASSSDNKIEIYAAMGVLELWLYKQGRLVIWVLQGDRYEVAVQSLSFPQVSVTQLNDWLLLREQGTDLTVVKAVRAAFV